MKNNKLLVACFSFCLIILCNHLVAQVSVREEPHHKVVLENDYVRLIDVHIPSGDTTLYHIHASPSVIVHISRSTTGTQIMGEKPSSPGEVLPGQTSYAAYDEKPIKHRVWNQGSSMFHVMDIELVKKKPNDDTCSIISQSGVQLQWLRKLVRTYRLDIGKSQTYSLPKSNCAYLLIDISGIITTASSGSIRMVQSGGYVFFPPQSNIQISSSNKENAQCVLLELK